MTDKSYQHLAPRTIQHVNLTGFLTLVEREVGRFINVYTQTVVAPVITTLLFFAVFSLALGGQQRQIGDIPFMEFLAPGLLMMTMVQNAFANTSSSIIIGKVQGNIVDVLMPPLSAFEFFMGYMMGGLLRGLMVGLVTAIAISFFVTLKLHSIPCILAYAVLGNMMLSTLGLAAGIWSDKFDHIAAVTNFIVTPMTFLSGTFYSVDQLPSFWAGLAHYNPFFYMIDGYRYGFSGHADGSIAAGLMVLVAANLLLSVLTLWMIRKGYKIKS